MCSVTVKELSLNTLDDTMSDSDSEGVPELVESSDEDATVNSHSAKPSSKSKSCRPDQTF